MCARFTLRQRLNLVMQELAEMLPVGMFDFDPEPAFNIAPTQKVAAVRSTADAGKNELVPLKWGLIPFWAKDPKIASSLINARAARLSERLDRGRDIIRGGKWWPATLRRGNIALKTIRCC